MNRPPSDPTEPNLDGAATEFERRLLDAARASGPSGAASARMARALGVSAVVATTATAATTTAADVAASKATAAAAGAGTAWPWVSAGVLGLVVAGAVVGVRARHASHPASRPAPPPMTAPAPPVSAPGRSPTEYAARPVEAPPVPALPSHRTRVAPATGELRDQIEFIDAARAALSAGADRRALELLRRYEEKYPGGSFRPEATALKVEGLLELGRQAEGRALAERFVAEHRGSLLAARVAKLAGLTP